MKRILLKHGHHLAALALLVTVFACNRTCYGILYEPKLPKEASIFKKL